MVQSTLKHKRECLNALGLGGHLSPLQPPLSSLHCGKEMDSKWGKHKLLLFSPHPGLFSCVCKHNSEPVSREGKTCFSSPAWVTSGYAKLHGKATSAPAVLISLMADLWEDMGIVAMPGKGWRTRGSAMPFLPCAFIGKGPVVPHCLSCRSSSTNHRSGPNSSKHFLLSEGRRSCSA